MPNVTEYSCRLKNPKRFQQKTFRRISSGDVDLIIARPYSKTKTRAQAIRYPRELWDENAARRSCQKRGGKFEDVKKPGFGGAAKQPWQMDADEFYQQKSDDGSYFGVWMADDIARKIPGVTQDVASINVAIIKGDTKGKQRQKYLQQLRDTRGELFYKVNDLFREAQGEGVIPDIAELQPLYTAYQKEIDRFGKYGLGAADWAKDAQVRLRKWYQDIQKNVDRIHANPHRYFIQQAISDGKPVPDKVMSEYPGLKKEEITPMSQIIPYSPQLPIVNIHNMPSGTGAKYLLAIRGEGDALIAKQWKRKIPTVLKQNEVIIDFETAEKKPPWELPLRDYVYSIMPIERGKGARQGEYRVGTTDPGKYRYFETEMEAHRYRDNTLIPQLRPKHKQLIQNAINIGITIPPEVIPDYPELIEKAKSQPHNIGGRKPRKPKPLPPDAINPQVIKFNSESAICYGKHDKRGTFRSYCRLKKE